MSNVVSVYDVSNLYRVPLVLQSQSVGDILIKRLNLPVRQGQDDTPVLAAWQNIANVNVRASLFSLRAPHPLSMLPVGPHPSRPGTGQDS